MQQIEETFEMKLSSKPSMFSDEIFFAIYSEITPPPPPPQGILK